MKDTKYKQGNQWSEKERERKKRERAAGPAVQRGVGGGGVDMEVNTEVNAVKCTLKSLNKTKKSLVAACSDFTVH